MKKLIIPAAVLLLTTLTACAPQGRTEAEICADYEAIVDSGTRTSLDQFREDAAQYRILGEEALDAGHDELGELLTDLGEAVIDALDHGTYNAMADAGTTTSYYCMSL